LQSDHTHYHKNGSIRTFPVADVPTGSGLTVTVPFKASSRTVGDIVVLIGTPSLLKRGKMNRNSLGNNESSICPIPQL
jgi:hypothetical protein